MNLCTDQLALLLAKPGQLQAVTRLSHDPAQSLLAKQAQQLPAHRNTAEEIYTMNADLILAGTYTSRTTLEMLEHLGQRVVTIPPAFSFADIRKNIKQVGAALGQTEAAAQMIQDFDRRLQALNNQSRSADRLTDANKPARKLTAASYGANLYMQSGHSLEKDMVEAAGFRHYGAQQQLGEYGGRVALEQLVLQPPDVLLMSGYQHRQVRAYAHLMHPALKRLIPPQRRASTQSRYWVCGTPLVLDAVEELITLRMNLESPVTDTGAQESL